MFRLIRRTLGTALMVRMIFTFICIGLIIKAATIQPVLEEFEHKTRGVLVTFANNSQLDSIIEMVSNVQHRFNNKYNYDWVFLSPDKFTKDFKMFTKDEVSGNAKYGVIPQKYWSFNQWFDLNKVHMEKDRTDVLQTRFQTEFLYRHKLLKDYEWYWRIEPTAEITCDINYDVFQYMGNHNKLLGVIGMSKGKDASRLWKYSKEFMNEFPEYKAKNKVLSDTSNCYFLTNFEIGNLEIWRSERYNKFFQYLENTGVFFNEDWEEAQVHSIAAHIFLERKQIHVFQDLGFRHDSIKQCPKDKEIREKYHCNCEPETEITSHCTKQLLQFKQSA